jgi:hypothetical protein
MDQERKARTVIADIRDSRFPEIVIEPNTFVVWRNLDPFPHSAETLPTSSRYFSAGALLPGEASSPVLFRELGQVDYICRFHAGMSGVVTVRDGPAAPGGPGAHPGHLDAHDGGHGDHDHLKHFHGFVTGGRSGQRFFMTHTPVIADPRHHFQVILQGSLTQPAHVAAYDSLRASGYGDGRVQIFHAHLSLPEIGSGAITTLPQSSFEFYPNGVDAEGAPVPGLEEKIPVRLDRVLHFRAFDPDADYPDGLTFLVYGDQDDVFLDHYIDRAPSFHSVAKLKQRPAFWTQEKFGAALKVAIPSKRIFDVSPKVLRRVGFVDNAFHIYWLPPSGTYLPPPGRPQDPLIPRGEGATAVYDVLLEDGSKGQIEIGRFLHFDVRLLNYGVLIV